MKINPKRLRKLLANSFILVTTITLASCSPVDGIKMLDSDMITIETYATQSKTDTIEEKYEELFDSFIEEKKEEILEKQIEEKHEKDEEKTVEKLVEPVYSFLTRETDTSVIINPNDYILDNLDELYSLDKITIQQQTLALYAYKRLILSGIPRETFEEQLNNIMIEQIIPRCLDDETWETYYGDLNKTLAEQESLIDIYGTLAWLIHDEFCDEEHDYEFGSIKCKSLTEQFNNRYLK